MPAHTSEPNPSNERTIVAAEAFVVVAAAEAPVVVIDMLIIEEALEVALAGRLDRAVSVVSAADKPVTLVQSDGGAIFPAIKFTAAHLKRSDHSCSCSKAQLETLSYLVENSVWRILNDSNDTLGTSPRSRDSNGGFTISTETSLLDGG